MIAPTRGSDVIAIKRGDLRAIATQLSDKAALANNAAAVTTSVAETFKSNATSLELAAKALNGMCLQRRNHARAMWPPLARFTRVSTVILCLS